MACCGKCRTLDITLDQLNKFFGAFMNQGGTAEMLGFFTEHPEQMFRLVELAQGTVTPQGVPFAQKLLQDHYLSTETISKLFGVTYSTEQLDELRRSLPNEHLLQWLHQNEFILLPGLPHDLFLPELISYAEEFLYPHTLVQFKDGLIKTNDHVVAAKWLAVSKTVARSMFYKKYLEQVQEMNNKTRVANLVEFIYAFVAYHKATDKKMVRNEGQHRTSTAVHTNSRYTISLSRPGIHIGEMHDGEADMTTALAVAMK